MNSFFVVFATIVVAVNARAGRQGWGVPSGGWPAPTAPPPTAAPGWPAPTVAPGWPAPSPAPTGWTAPPANNVVVATTGDLAASANGWSASSQNDELIGSNIAVNTYGDGITAVSQVGAIGQNTLINPTDAVGVQTVDVNQAATAAQFMNTSILGEDLASASFSGWAGAAGDASSSANGAVDVLVNKP